MADSPSNIQSSMPRGTPVTHSVVNGFQPQNGHGKDAGRNTAGKDTRNIEKSSSKPQAGPKTNNL